MTVWKVLLYFKFLIYQLYCYTNNLFSFLLLWNAMKVEYAHSLLVAHSDFLVLCKAAFLSTIYTFLANNRYMKVSQSFDSYL